MKHLAYLCLSAAWGGLEMNQVRNAKWMKERGHQVHLVVHQKSPALAFAIHENIPYYIVRKNPSHYQWFFAGQLNRQFKKWGVDHVIFRNNRELSLAASIHYFSGGRIHVHYFMEMALPGPKKQWFRALRYRWIDHWICPLTYLTQQVKDWTSFSTANLLTIPSGIELTRCAFSKEAAKNRLNWSQNTLALVMVGRVDPKKRQKEIWEAFSKREAPNERLIFVGASTADESNQYEQELRRAIAAHPKNQQVSWTGFLADLSLVYCAADVLVMASAFETVGMATLEAQFFGCPVLACNAGGSYELLTRFGGGLLMQPNLHDFSARLDQLLANDFPPLHVAFQQHFSHHAVCQAVEEKVLNFESWTSTPPNNAGNSY
jgi:glycosyltransferase involved in cell wall biosynthesis